MLRTNVSLKTLCLRDWIAPRGQGDGTISGNHDDDVEVDHHDSCRILLDAIPDHPHLQSLCVEDARLRIDAGATALALGPGPSKLCTLLLRGRFSPEGFVDLLFRLRTNETLRRVQVSMEASPELALSHLRMADALLTTYNCTLEVTCLGIRGNAWHGGWRPGWRAPTNRPARIARQHLQRGNYAISGPVSVWPLVLERVGRFPTLVYRFLRRGITPALAEHLSSSLSRGRQLSRPGPTGRSGKALSHCCETETVPSPSSLGIQARTRLIVLWGRSLFSGKFSR
jgi:hypothetical protein